MPYVTCPTCGERGKITSSLIGVRIKCRKCGDELPGLARRRARRSVGAGPRRRADGHSAAAGPSAVVEAQGIEVEGLDASSWAVPDRAAAAIAAAKHPRPRSPPTAPVAVPDAGVRSGRPPTAAPAREYKLLTSRDKYFDGKFDLARLEEALNHFARLGWVAKSMVIPTSRVTRAPSRR